MSIVHLPAELLLALPQYLHSLEDLFCLFSTCRTLYNTCGNPDPKLVPRLAAQSGRVFFRPHPHFLIAAMARQVADWAVKADDRRYRLEVAIQGGVEKLLDLAIDVAELTMDDIRRLYTYKCDVINPLNRKLDLAAGPATNSSFMVCNDPETTLLSWVIYGELFHHSYDLLFLPLPEHKPLSSVLRYKWFVYCVPDVNSFDHLGFDQAERPAFFNAYVQKDDDRFQQLSMSQAIREMLEPSLWERELQPLQYFQDMNRWEKKLYISCVMHLGLKSLEILRPGGIERLCGELDQIAQGIRTFSSEDDSDEDDSGPVDATDKRLLAFVGDRWLHTVYLTLEDDLGFTLWSWSDLDGETDVADLMKAIRRAPTLDS